MLFMKLGCANHWAEQIFTQEDAEGLPFMDWMDFKSTFWRNFTPLNSDSAAVNKLKGNSSFQRERSVDDYIDEFQDLIYKSGYTDPCNIVVKFRRGLNRQISLAILGMAIGRPSDVEPKSWYELATQLDQNRAADKAFMSSHCGLPTPHFSVPTPSFAGISKTFPIVNPNRFAHSTPFPGKPVPMDIDE